MLWQDVRYAVRTLLRNVAGIGVVLGVAGAIPAAMQIRTSSTTWTDAVSLIGVG